MIFIALVNIFIILGKTILEMISFQKYRNEKIN
jgi:hypothetical protein